MFKVRKNPDVLYFFKVNDENTRILCEICSKLKLVIYVYTWPEWDLNPRPLNSAQTY